jgi:hypothetical protein
MVDDFAKFIVKLVCVRKEHTAEEMAGFFPFNIEALDENL